MSAKTTEPIPAVGIKAMNWAMNPAIIINPAATPQDLFSWAVAELQNLHEWLDIMACSTCDFQIEPSQLAGMVIERLRPVMQGCHAALEGDIQGMEGGAA